MDGLVSRLTRISAGTHLVLVYLLSWVLAGRQCKVMRHFDFFAYRVGWHRSEAWKVPFSRTADAVTLG